MNENMEFLKKSSVNYVLTSYERKDLPEEVIRARRKVYIDECKLLDESFLECENDQQGVHFCLYDKASSALMGSIHVCLAEHADVSRYYEIPAKDLGKCIYSSRAFILPEYRNQKAISILLYAVMQWGRMQGRSFYLAFYEGGAPVAKLLRSNKLEHVRPRLISLAGSIEYNVELYSGRIDVAMACSFGSASQIGQAFIREKMFPHEIESTAMRLIYDFYENGWFEGIRNGTMSKMEYIDALINLHNYVRWTTRLLARAITISDDRKLRKHFIEHLRGEVDHEVMLERDLNALGFDASFYTKALAPNPDIYCFMAVEQSLVAFEQDPTLFLAVPVIAEGLSAFLSPTLLSKLEELVQGWGVANPRSAMTFLRSHILTDGGEDGHWNAVLEMLCKYVDTETTLQKVLTIMHASAVSQKRAFEQFASARNVFGPQRQPTGEKDGLDATAVDFGAVVDEMELPLKRAD